MFPQRNKGYCFVHFMRDIDARQFCDRINFIHPRSRHGKQMYTTLAVLQGVKNNLTNLIGIRSRKWRPRQGIVYVRTQDGLRCTSLLTLRTKVKAILRPGGENDGNGDDDEEFDGEDFDGDDDDDRLDSADLGGPEDAGQDDGEMPVSNDEM
jgi:hypothetical protein